MTDSFALYVHAPFCVRKCRYCEFASEELRDTSQADEVVDGILREARTRACEEPWRDRTLHSLYLGGGTPSLLLPDQVLRLVYGLQEVFSLQEGAECTIEANPGTLSPSRLDAWLELGLERVSLGVQSLQESVLHTLGRIHTADLARRAYQTLVDAGFPRINVDLIFGTCTDKVFDGWRDTLDEVIRWQPEHVSAYSLILEKGTPLYHDHERGLQVKVDEEIELQLFKYTIEALEEAGYLHYEVSNWAGSARERSRHNLSYWDGSPYLAIGPAGHSFDGDRTRWWNHRDSQQWLNMVQKEGSGKAAEEVLSPLMRYEEIIMLGLRMIEGVEEVRAVAAATDAGRDWPPESLDMLLERRLLLAEGGRIRFSREGLMIADEVIAHLLRDV
ncbi:radical SAM family heme chaperone HemW [bacterium]|nr:radical SAM family heme chaperone HemW [bacterium]